MKKNQKRLYGGELPSHLPSQTDSVDRDDLKKARNREYQKKYRERMMADSPEAYLSKRREYCKRHREKVKLSNPDPYMAANRKRALLSYHTRKAASPDGFLAERRKMRSACRSKNLEMFRARDREAYRRYKDRYPDKVRERKAAAMRESRIKNPNKHKAKSEKWRKANPEKVREIGRRRWNKYVSIPRNALRARVSTLVRMSLKRGSKSASIARTLDFTVNELGIHLERQFLHGMGWHNMGEWHIDHIVPLSSFNFSSDLDPEFKRAWHITNLRPLWGRDNVRKSNRITHLI